MPELLRTTEEGMKPHYHVVYLRDDGTGVTTENHGHSHDVIFQQEQEAILNEFGQVVQEGVEGGIILSVSGDDYHTHDLAEYEIKEEKPKGKEEEIVRDIAEKYFEAVDFEDESREDGYEAEDIIASRHWDPQKKSELEGKSRAATTVNKVEQKLDNLCGYQRQNRTDIKFLPMEGGDEIVAEILNYVTKNILEQCFYGREESKAFEDSAIVGRGLLHAYIDYEKNIRGDIVVERWKWDEAAFGEHCKEDLSDCEMEFKWRWYSISKLKEMYPEKADELMPEAKDRPTHADEVAEDWDKRLRSDEMVNSVTKKYRVVEARQKVFKRVFIIANIDDDFVFNAEGWKQSDIDAIKSIEGFKAIPRTSYKMRVTKFASNVLLEDEYIEDDDFSLIPVYAKFRNNRFWGKVKNIAELQYLINKAYSQFVDILNKVANYGWFYDDDTFPDKNEKLKWEQNASSPGFNQRINDVSRPPVQVSGVKFPVEIINSIAQFNQDMREVMNVNLEMQGLGGAESGIAIRQKIVQQLLGNDYLFDNLSFAKVVLGRKLIKMIQKTFTPERILRLIKNQNAREPISLPARPEMLGQEALPMEGEGAMQQIPQEVPLEAYPEEELLYLLETADLGQYDVISSESATSPSVMMGNFMLLTELAAKGVTIPPEAIMEVAPIPQKNKILQIIAQSQQAAQDMENKKYDTEIQKTLINAQTKSQMPSGQQAGF